MENKYHKNGPKSVGLFAKNEVVINKTYFLKFTELNK